MRIGGLMMPRLNRAENRADEEVQAFQLINRCFVARICAGRSAMGKGFLASSRDEFANGWRNWLPPCARTGEQWSSRTGEKKKKGTDSSSESVPLLRYTPLGSNQQPSVPQAGGRNQRLFQPSLRRQVAEFQGKLRVRPLHHR